MAKNKATEFSRFFKENAATSELLDRDKETDSTPGISKANQLPKIDVQKPLEDDDLKREWNKLRNFFRNSNAHAQLGNLTPVLTSPYFAQSQVSTDFPLWVADEESAGQRESDCISLSDLLNHCISTFGKENEEPSILSNNVVRIVNIANGLLEGNPRHFAGAIAEVLSQLETTLDVTGDDEFAFNNDLAELRKALPTSGVLLPYSNMLPFQILEASIISSSLPARKDLAKSITKLTGQLNNMVLLETSKSGDSKNPDKLKSSMDVVQDRVNFDELSTLLPDSASQSLAEERLTRINNVLSTFTKHIDTLNTNAFIHLDEILSKDSSYNWKGLFEGSSIETFKAGKGSDTVQQSFNESAELLTPLFIAKRIAELEICDAYRAAVHDDYFENFDWQNLHKDELAACPPVIMIADDLELLDDELSRLSALFTRGYPINVLAVKRKTQINHGDNGLELKTNEFHSHAELGALAILHRNVYVSQSTAVSPIAMFNSIADALPLPLPGLHYVLSATGLSEKESYLWTSAAVEGREFSGFTYKGMLGTPWGSRFNILNNPQPECEWPEHSIDITNETGENSTLNLHFTFADFVALDPHCHHHFMPVPNGCWTDDLIALTSYLANDENENIGKVPYTWMMDSTNTLVKVAVSWTVVQACFDRLDYWKFLQENSGINNYHVTNALKEAEERIQNEFNVEISNLKDQHASELQAVRDEEAGQTMEKLASILLDLDTTSVIATSNSSAPTAPSIETSEPEQVQEEKSEEPAQEESLSTSEPWIETPLCTSCNECLDINGAMFKYNKDKMAYLADAKAGTFAQLVEAAELCPVSIIHPGDPLNPNETDLDDLIARAEKFN